jgi:effector-binding domain-containing protein
MSPCDLEDFDWVSARAQCEPFKVFEKLRAQVKEDVKKRDSLPKDGIFVAFSFEEGNGWITASKKILDKYEGVTFTLTPNGITAQDLSRSFTHTGNLTLSDGVAA